MSKDKSLGLDGLTVEFDTTFWSVIKEDYVEVVKTCNKMGSVPNTMNTALICLIFKNKWDKSDFKKMRHISVYSTWITKVLLKPLQTSFKKEHTCRVKGRNIHDNLLILRDTVNYVNSGNRQAAMLSIG